MESVYKAEILKFIHDQFEKKTQSLFDVALMKLGHQLRGQQNWIDWSQFLIYWVILSTAELALRKINKKRERKLYVLEWPFSSERAKTDEGY